MGMSIRTNTGGNTSCRNLKRSSKKGDGNLQKLASGYQINRSADDASGLGITEKMRAQISALTNVVDGCGDGVNLVKTADGYLGEMQDMIVRMTELAEKSADGILDDEVDRAALQKEMNHLGAEIDRIAETANFNGNDLFKADAIMRDVKKIIQVQTPVRYSEFLKDCNNLPDSKCLSTGKDSTVVYLAEQTGKYILQNNNDKSCLEGKAIYYAEGPKSFIASNDPVPSDEYIRSQLGISSSEPYMQNDFGYNNGTFRISPMPKFVEGDDDEGSVTANALKNALNTELSNHNNEISCFIDKKIYYTKTQPVDAFVGASDLDPAQIKQQLGSEEYNTANIITKGRQYSIPEDTEITVQEPDNKEIVLQVGETSERADKLAINIYDMHTDKLFKSVTQVIQTGAKTHTYTTPGGQYHVWDVSGNSSGADAETGTVTTTGGTHTVTVPEYETINLNAIVGNNETSGYENAVTFDISTQENAISNLESIRNASEFISLVRADYGSKENRLDYTINNINTSVENVSAAKSRIKDTDMAKEIMAYTQNNVLQQSAQSMLAQANTRPQDALQLLQ